MRRDALRGMLERRTVRAEFDGTAVNALLPEGAPFGSGFDRMAFDPGNVLVYRDDWRIEPQREAA
mgnify:CR=1 FL=1